LTLIFFQLLHGKIPLHGRINLFGYKSIWVTRHIKGLSSVTINIEMPVTI